MPTKLLSMSRLSPSSVARGERDEYEGERDAAGRPHGKGGQLYANGNQYDGAWDAGVRHGHGIQTWTNGDKYDGYWNAGVQHGYGLQLCANGNKYEGAWKAGVRHGHGVCTWADGLTHEGEWSNGVVEEELSFGITVIVGFVTALFANTQAKWLLCGLMVLGLRWKYARLKDNARLKHYFLSEWCRPLSFIAAALLVPSSEAGYIIKLHRPDGSTLISFSSGYAFTVMVKCVLFLFAKLLYLVRDAHYFGLKRPDENDDWLSTYFAYYFGLKRPDEKDDWLTDGLSLGSVAKNSAVNKQAARQAAARRESAQLRAAKRKAESEDWAMKKMKEAATKEAEKRAAAKKAQVEEREAAKKRAVASAAARRELERKEAEKRAEAMKAEQMKDAARKVVEKTQVLIAE
jgi:hypothetical protein